MLDHNVQTTSKLINFKFKFGLDMQKNKFHSTEIE